MEKWFPTAIAVLCLVAGSCSASKKTCVSSPLRTKLKDSLDEPLKNAEQKLQQIGQQINKLAGLFDQTGAVNGDSPACTGQFSPPVLKNDKIVMCMVTDKMGNLILNQFDISLCTHAVIRPFSTGWSRSDLQYTEVRSFKDEIRKQSNIPIILDIVLYGPTSWTEFVFNTIMETGVDGGLFSIHNFEPLDEKRKKEPLQSWEKFLVVEATFLKARGKMVFVELPLDHERGKLKFNYETLEKLVDKWILPSYWIQNDLGRAMIREPIETLAQHLLFISRWFQPEKVILQRSTEFHHKLLKTNKMNAHNKINSLTEGQSYLNSTSLGSLEMICNETKNKINKLKLVYNETNVFNVYANSKKEWISFDSPSILRKKIKLVQHFKFAGVFLNFTLGDDISEACNCGKFPLVRTISEELLAGGRCKVEGCLV